MKRMIEERIQTYKILVSENKIKSDRLGKKMHLLGTIRFILFLGIIFGIYMLAGDLNLLAPLILIMTLVFACLFKQHNRLSDQKETAESLILLAENELMAFRHDFSVFNGAGEKRDPSYPFSYDLDIFGENSFFQQINRTVLPIGEQKLADMIQYPLTDKDAILGRQQAIMELAGKEEFCLRFRTAGMKVSSSTVSDINFTTSTADKGLVQNIFWNSAVWITPILYLVFVVLWLTDIVPGGLFLYLYLFTFALSLMPMKKVKATWGLFDKRSKRLNAFAYLFMISEQENTESPLLMSLQRQLTQHGKASEAIRKLSQQSRNLDVGFTLAMLILNPLFQWTTLYALKIERWMKNHGGDVETWFALLAEMDALISLGTFALNNPDYCYPEISDTHCFRGEGLGHPLIPCERCVRNDIDISRKPFFMIVTGANMAGKSTYLRTMGINHVMASVGMPVCAERLVFIPGKLLTNLRTSDSLVNNESYFFAELKRLKMIIDRLESGEEGLFIILDEILKGTNSEDKQRGSLALMKRLVGLGGSGIIATHDLALGNMEKEFPQEIKNWHFDAVIDDEALTFSYKLQEGIARNMNASFLMRKMGITE